MSFRIFVIAALLAACGTSSPDVDIESRDPRCVSACPETMPRYEGVGRVCDTASRAQCLDECEVRIAGVTPICQSCLAEKACFGPDGCSSDDGIVYGMCTNTSCTITSEYGSCTYSTTDEAAKLKCYQQVDPRREVACTPEFRPTTECASVCSGQ
jgi:hypothetical protein